MRVAFAVLVLVLSSCSSRPPKTTSQKPTVETHPQYVRFVGEVKDGHGFEKEFGDGLLFRLDASDDPAIPGWIIEVRAKKEPDPQVELVWVATPPFRFFNPRYMDVSYGHSAAQSVAINPRRFTFLVRPEDYLEEAAAVRQMLWPADEAEFKAALQRAGKAPRCDGTFRILEHRIGTPLEGGMERIEWLKFEVELCAVSKER